jgi:hypothetical protein
MGPMVEPMGELSFPHLWQAKILPSRPAILPQRHYVYPRAAEEVERGALEVTIHSGTPNAMPFLATCAVGYLDPAVPTGIWSAPRAEEICAVAGGYAYVIDTTAPERFTMIPYRPVLTICAAVAEGLLLFAGHRSIFAWGRNGQAWESAKLSDEGVTIESVAGGVLCGTGWEMAADREEPFALDLRTGKLVAPPRAAVP